MDLKARREFISGIINSLKKTVAGEIIGSTGENNCCCFAKWT